MEAARPAPESSKSISDRLHEAPVAGRYASIGRFPTICLQKISRIGSPLPISFFLSLRMLRRPADRVWGGNPANGVVVQSHAGSAPAAIGVTG